jgi:hypothetical protein
MGSDLLAWERVPGNREVSRRAFFTGRADASGASAEACRRKKKGGRGGNMVSSAGAKRREEMLRALAEARERDRLAAAPA